MHRFRPTPFAWLMIFLCILLALGIWILYLGLQPPRITQALPYTV